MQRYKYLLRCAAAAILFGWLCSMNMATAQNPGSIDIRLQESSTTPGTLEVQVRANGQGFGDVVSNLTFSLRWATGTTAALGTRTGDCPGALPSPTAQVTNPNGPPCVPPSTCSGAPTGFNYRTYNLVMLTLLDDEGCPWPQDAWTTVMRVPVTNNPGCTTFEVTNDAWVSDPVINRKFFCSLGGIDKTGVIVSGQVQVGACGTVDCLGVPGGTALPGTACNDNNTCTTGDVWSAQCVCTGTPIAGPVMGAVTNNGPICAGQTLNLNASATGTGTITYAWSGPNGFSSNLQNPSIGSATVAAFGTYTVTASNGCGTNASGTTTATVNAAPSATISYAGSPYCGNAGTASVSLTGTGGGTFASTAGLSINSSTGAVNLGASTPGAYIVTYTVAAGGGCAQFQTTAGITITAAPNATISYTGSPYCSNAGTASVSRTGTAGGTYASTAGLSINSSTGAVNLGASTPGSYTVTYTVAAAGGCAQFQTTAGITITAAPNATISYTGSPYCSNAGTASVSRTGTAGGTYASTAGLSINSSTGAVDLGASTPGAYTVTYTVAAGGGCAQFQTTAGITITAAPSATISYAGSPYCSNAGTASVTRTGTSGGTYTASPAGLSIVAATGAVDLSLSTPGVYTVTYTIAASGGCAQFQATAGISITAAQTWYHDVDQDGFGDPNDVLLACSQPANYVSNNTDNCPTLFGRIGDACSDGNAGTINDVITANCICAGTQPNDCLGVPGGPAQPGSSCNDNNACTTNDTWSPNCVCVGTAVPGPTMGAVGNNGPVCAGQPVNLTATATGAGTITYAWSGPNGFLASQQNPTISAATVEASGTYTVTASNGCGTNATGTTTAAVNTPASASISYTGSPYCGGAGSASITRTGTAGGTYAASPAGLSIVAGTGSVDLSLSSPGTYTVTYTIAASGGCPQFQTTTGITILAPQTWYHDVDDDGFGDPGDVLLACSQPTNYVTDNTDNCPTLFGRVGDACNDNNPATSGDVITAQCVCAGTLADDCEGVPGGPAQPGTPCNDGDACTVNDVWSAQCACEGTFADADADGLCDANDNCPNLPGVQGDACNDNNPATTGDVITAQCVCAGTLADDCEGVPGGPAQPGTACDDGDACTVNDVYSASCVCEGTVADADADGLCDANDNCPNLPGVQGDACNDNNPATTGDVINVDCICIGTLPPDCAGVPGGSALPGTACDDGNAGTINDTWSANCVCVGIPTNCTENLTLSITLDNNGAQTTWTLYDETETLVIDGGGPFANGVGGTTVVEDICVPIGCYHLVVSDAGGNGITGGGYVLRDAQGRRIIDATGAFGAQSRIGGVVNRAFCVPTNNLGMIGNWCDRTNLALTSPVYSNAQPGASGYQFWIFDPHGSYNRRVLKPTNVLIPVQLNTDPVPANVDLNIRVRALVNGTYTGFGRTCRIRFRPLGSREMEEEVRVVEPVEEVAMELVVFPNPSRGDQVFLNLDGVQQDIQAVTVDVYDSFGKRVLTGTLPVQDGSLFNQALQLSPDLSAGLYVLNITAGERSITERLIIQR